MYGTKYFDENFLGKSQIMGNAQYGTLIQVKSSEVKCIYMGTTQRFPAPVLAWMQVTQVPNTVVRVR